MLIGGLAMNKSVLSIVFDNAMALTERGWRLLTYGVRLSWRPSRAADFAGFRPLIGQPLGMIHRFVCRVVTRRISGAPDFVKR